jgi:hypothetical protein
MVMKNNGTKIGSIDLEYCNHEHNHAYINERTIEVPLGNYFINKFKEENVFEVGAVMPYYGLTGHKVLDLYDNDGYKECIRINACDYDYSKLNVLSISTIEHIGMPDYGAIAIEDGYKKAFNCIEKIIKESNNYLITIPIGYNIKLDELIRLSNLKVFIIVRDEDNNWDINLNKYMSNKFEYAKPYTCANALFIITNLEEFYDQAKSRMWY